MKEDSVCAIFAHTAEDGKNYETKFYRLEAVLAVGYRVNSIQATVFRKWATTTLNEFSDYPILKDKGKVSMLEAKLKAAAEYDKFRVIQDKNYESDFDKMIKKLRK